MDIFSPIDNSLVGTIPEMSADEVNQAIEAAFLAQKNWENKKILERIKILKKVVLLLEQQKDDFASFITLEIGKIRKEAEDEVLRTIEMINSFSQEAIKIADEVIKSESKGKTALTKRVPWGVVLAISPFNYPINEAAPKIVAALLVGNSVIFKPSTQGAISGTKFAKLFEEAGVGEALKTITGKTEELGDFLVSHPKISAINFTGSYKTGEHITQVAGIKKLILGLSAKDAAIVLADCDMELAVSEIALGAFSLSGQRCTAIKRVLIEEKIADQFLDKFAREVEKKFILGDPRKEGVTLGPVISDEATDYIWELIEDAKTKGAIVITGGKRDGRLIEATVLDYVTEKMRIAWEEPFGPVLPIIRVKDTEEAVRLANQSEYGLQSSIFINNFEKANEIAQKLEVGTVQINARDSRAPDIFPFTGFKHSGLGMVGGTKYLLNEMTRLKTVVIQNEKH